MKALWVRHDEHNVSKIAHKLFNRTFQAGKRLRTLRRANASISTAHRDARKEHWKDVVARALRELRAQPVLVASKQRQTVVAVVAYQWLARKEQANGFLVAPQEFAVENMDFLSSPHGEMAMTFGVIGTTADITVDNPESLRQASYQVLGAALSGG